LHTHLAFPVRLPTTFGMFGQKVKLQLFFIVEGDEAVTTTHAIPVGTDVVLVLVMQREAGPAGVELVATAKPITEAAKMVSPVHVLQQGLVVVLPLATKLTERMRWYRQDGPLGPTTTIPATVTIPTVALEVVVAIGVLLTDESRPRMEARATKLPPMLVPQVVLKLAEAAKGMLAIATTCVKVAAVTQELQRSTPHAVIGKSHAKGSVTRKPPQGSWGHRCRAVIGDEHLFQPLFAHRALPITAECPQPQTANPANVDVPALPDAKVGWVLGATQEALLYSIGRQRVR